MAYTMVIKVDDGTVKFRVELLSKCLIKGPEDKDCWLNLRGKCFNKSPFLRGQKSTQAPLAINLLVEFERKVL